VSFSRLLDPIFLILVGLVAGLVIETRARRVEGPRSRAGRTGVWLFRGATLLLWLCALPLTGDTISRVLEPAPTDLAAILAGKDRDRVALVVLAGSMQGTETGLPLLERIGGETFRRVVGGARLYREHPIGSVIVSGRVAGTDREDTVRAMTELLVTYGVPRDRIVMDAGSGTTRESAENVALLTRSRGLETVVVVTSALHTPRALRDFERAGIAAVGAPVDFDSLSGSWAERLIPSSGAVKRTDVGLHEIFGLLR
jgi:uncharacterized SAM-binding protein YcdF (DUF218 family)